MEFVSLDQQDDFYWLRLQRPKVNALNHQMIREIKEAFLQVAEAEKGLIFSGIPHIFSAGLDIVELINYNEEQMEAFFDDFLALYLQIAQFQHPLVCAITGHCPAGGTVLALGADYRVMAEDSKYQIGLNEMQVNILITDLLIRGYAYWIGEGKSHEAILEGKLFTPEEAKEVGLVQELAPLDQVEARAVRQMKKYLKLDRTLFMITKSKLRSNWLNIDPAKLQHDKKMTASQWWRPEIRQRMQLFVKHLTKS